MLPAVRDHREATDGRSRERVDEDMTNHSAEVFKDDLRDARTTDPLRLESAEQTAQPYQLERHHLADRRIPLVGVVRFRVRSATPVVQVLADVKGVRDRLDLAIEQTPEQ